MTGFENEAVIRTLPEFRGGSRAKVPIYPLDGEGAASPDIPAVIERRLDARLLRKAECHGTTTSQTLGDGHRVMHGTGCVASLAAPLRAHPLFECVPSPIWHDPDFLPIKMKYRVFADVPVGQLSSDVIQAC